MNSTAISKGPLQRLSLGACALVLLAPSWAVRAEGTAAPRMASPVPQLHVPLATLQSWPLPASLVLSGQPQASGLVLSKSADARQVSGVWSSTPGRFRWNWDYDETVFVLSGRATVELEDGRRVELVPGDMAFFARGDRSVWTIHETLRKGFHADSPEPLPF